MKLKVFTGIFLAGICHGATAANLAPGGDVYMFGVAPFDMGTELDSLTYDYTVKDVNTDAVVATGSVTHSVWRALDGTVDFYWQLSNDNSSLVAIEALRTFGFGTDPVEAEYITDATKTAPVVASRFDGSFAGYINFDFNDFDFGGDIGVDPGETSNLIFLDTMATDYNYDGGFDVTSDPFEISGSSWGFGPNELAPVPLPAAAWLFGSALLGLGALKRKRA